MANKFNANICLVRVGSPAGSRAGPRELFVEQTRGRAPEKSSVAEARRSTRLQRLLRGARPSLPGEIRSSCSASRHPPASDSEMFHFPSFPVKISEKPRLAPGPIAPSAAEDPAKTPVPVNCLAFLHQAASRGRKTELISRAFSNRSAKFCALLSDFRCTGLGRDRHPGNYRSWQTHRENSRRSIPDDFSPRRILFFRFLTT